MNADVPESIGEYRVTGLLGEGAVARVYSGVQPSTGRAVAIKVMREGHSPEYRTVERFIAEVHTVTQLRHPNIINIYAFGTLPDGRPYFVMEYRPGMTLQQRLDRDGPLTFLEAAPIFIQACRALQAAHEHGIIHRDLKPDNIYLSDEPGGPPVVKLLDFGIAKFSTQNSSAALTQVGSTVGTPLYMSPEQIRAVGLDARSDVYTLGVSLFQALTGEVPFYAESHAQTATMHLQQPPPRPSEVCDLLPIPERAEAIVMRCLAKNPADRFSSMRELGDALEAAAGELLSARQLAGVRELRLSLPSVPPLPPRAPATFDQGGLRGAGPLGFAERFSPAVAVRPPDPAMSAVEERPSLITPVPRLPPEPAPELDVAPPPREAAAGAGRGARDVAAGSVRSTAEVPAIGGRKPTGPATRGRPAPTLWRSWEGWLWALALLLGLLLLWLYRGQLAHLGQ